MQKYLHLTYQNVSHTKIENGVQQDTRTRENLVGYGKHEIQGAQRLP